MNCFARVSARYDLLFTMSDNTRMKDGPMGRIRIREIIFLRTSTKAGSKIDRRRTAGGARRDRTDDLLLAKQALSQLSYGPAAR